MILHVPMLRAASAKATAGALSALNKLTITLESDLTVVQPPAVPLVDSCCHRKAAAVGAIRAHE